MTGQTTAHQLTLEEKIKAEAKALGFVLSGIYGREESRVYAKPLVKGESTYMLTKEEKQAVDKAKQK